MKITAKNVGFSYSSDEKIFDNLSFEIEEGTFACVLGESGCGKSTLLRLLCGLETPDEGTIMIGEETVKKPVLSRSFVFQSNSLYPWLTAGENILLAIKQKFPNMGKADRKSLAISKLKEVGLDASTYNKYPKELSGGMQQRCAIARSLSVNSTILFLDEPFSALDAITRRNLQELLLNLWEEENELKTIVFVTHDVDEAILLSTELIILGVHKEGIIYKEKNLTKISELTEEEYRNKIIKKLNKISMEEK